MKQEIINQGKVHFENQWYCAESVLLAISDAAGIQSEFIPKIATGFCAGLARTNGICGAVTGGILAINLLTGRTESGASVDENFKMVEQLQKNFLEKFKSTNCRDLTNCDFSIPEGHIKFEKENIQEKCSEMVGETINIVLDIFNTFKITPFEGKKEN